MSNILNQFSGVAPGGNIPSLGGSQGGALNAFEDLQKALEASNYQTDVSTLTGGGSLGVQSLDTAMKSTIQENEHFTLFNRLARTSATNIVDEYVRQNSVGGFLGGSTNSQMGVVRAAQGDYAREVGLVKFLMSLRQVGYVLNIGKNIVEATAVEERNGALQLLTDAEYLLFHGNAAASPTQFDGIFTQIDAAVASGQMSADTVIDMQGAKLDSVTPFSQINVAVSRYGSWGRSTDVFLPVSIQNDLNSGLDPAYRWMPGGSNTPVLGGHVEGIRLTNGVLKTSMDTFLHDENNPMISPFEVNYAATAAANVAFKPTSIAVNPAPTNVSSQFSSTRAGNYYWAVASVGGNGEGLTQAVISTQQAVATGAAPVITITASAANTETGYAIYRSRQNGTGAITDLRLCRIIPKTGATTTYTDLNRDIPGTSSVPLLNMQQSADAIGWRQFQPMTKIPLPFGVGGMPVISWFQFLFGYLRITKPKHHGYIKNVLASNAVWRPFTNE
jgi:hypothetical protein